MAWAASITALNLNADLLTVVAPIEGLRPAHGRLARNVLAQAGADHVAEDDPRQPPRLGFRFGPARL